MSKGREDLGFLGLDYQFRLIAQFLTDKRFANSIMGIVNPNYFDDEVLRLIVAEMKGAFETHEVVPDVNSLQFRLMEKVTNEIQQKFILTQIKKIKDADLNDTLYVQEIAMKFCKQQELKKCMVEIQKIIDTGKLEDYDKCEDILKKALEIGDNKDDGIDVFYNIEDVLSDDFRDPIPTGIVGLDEKMNGGLAKGELGIILAPFGVGKTTMVTKIANTAKNLGKNVVQIFFEDNPKVIQRKHLACWTGIELNDLSNHKDRLMTLSEEKSKSGGSLKLKKFPSDGTTIPKIRQYLRKLIANGFRIDMVLVDYIDCVQPSKQFKDALDGEANVMRQFETMLDELNIVGWTAIQGNRSSINAEVVESHQMGGSIKKGQIGHFIVSVAKNLEQKENGTANMAILKSRFGGDGIIFEDVIFDNSRINIEINDKSSKTFLQTKHDKEDKNQQRVNEILGIVQRAHAQNNNEENN